MMERAAKNAGFRVNLFFVDVDSVDISRARVRRRVERGGGHGIPEQVQVRRFDRSLDNAALAARIADTTVLVNSMDEQFRSVGMTRRGIMAWRADMPGPQWLDRITRDLARTASTGRRRT